MIFEDGAYYEGDWLNDMAHGRGRHHHPSGIRYEGEWEEDCRQGYGVETHEKFTYQGNFKKNKRQGDGVYKWETGEIY